MAGTVVPVWQIVIVGIFAGLILIGLVYVCLKKVIMPWHMPRDNEAKRNGRLYVRHDALVCTECGASLYQLIERRKKERARRAVQDDTTVIEREFGCFNPVCVAGEEEHRIFGSYHKALGPEQHMRMRSEKPLEVVQKAAG
ncbi:MAG: hypothetical protein AAB581_04290 [Patescibacteria group bacterium]